MPTKSETRVEIKTLHRAGGGSYCNGVTWRDDFTDAAERPLYHRSKHWERTPDYHERIKAKAALPDLPFSFSEYEQDFGVMTLRNSSSSPCTGYPWDVASSYGLRQACLAGSLGPPVEGVHTTDTSLRSKLIGKAKAAEWNAPVFFGEARETLSMALGTAKKLASAYSSIRKGRLGDAYILLTGHGPSRRKASRFNSEFGKSPRDASANAWLELQYGWIPLLCDVEDAAKQMAEFDLQDEGLVKNQGRVTADSTYNQVFTEDVIVDVTNGVIATVIKDVTETRRMIWKFTATDMNNLGSLGLLNPLTVAWELLPLSFVVDWMLPIGSYLEGLDVPLRFKHAGGTSGWRQEVKCSYANLRYNEPEPGHSVSGSYTFRRVEVRRDPLGSVPTVGLEQLTFAPDLGVKRFFSGMALASQRFKR